MRFFSVGTKVCPLYMGVCIKCVSVEVPLYNAMLRGTDIIDKAEYDVIIVDYSV